MYCQTCSRPGFQNAAEVAGHLVTYHLISPSAAGAIAAQWAIEQRDKPAPVPPPTFTSEMPEGRDPDKSLDHWRTYPGKKTEAPVRAETRPCGCQRMGKHLKGCKEAEPESAKPPAVKVRRIKVRVKRMKGKAPRRPKALAVVNGHDHRAVSKEAVQLLHRQLTEERIDLQAQIQVIDRLLARATSEMKR